MDQFQDALALIATSLYGLVALGLFCISVWWMFNRKAMQRQMAGLRVSLDEMQEDPSGDVKARALYTSLMIDAQTRQFLNDAGYAHHVDGGSFGMHGTHDGG